MLLPSLLLQQPNRESQMDQPLALPAIITLPSPAMDAELLQTVRRLGLRSTLQMLRDYCHDQGESAFDDGHTGMGWYEMHDAIDDIIPAGDDVALDGDVRGQRVGCSGIRGAWK